MFNVLEQVDAVNSDDVSLSNEYVIERRGGNFDGTIDSGSRTAYTDPYRPLIEARRLALVNNLPDFWMPIEDWKLD